MLRAFLGTNVFSEDGSVVKAMSTAKYEGVAAAKLRAFLPPKASDRKQMDTLKEETAEFNSVIDSRYCRTPSKH